MELSISCPVGATERRPIHHTDRDRHERRVPQVGNSVAGQCDQRGHNEPLAMLAHAQDRVGAAEIPHHGGVRSTRSEQALVVNADTREQPPADGSKA